MKETYYFSHDYNATQDPKIMILLSECGLSGLALYWILIEILHQQPESKISTDAYSGYLAFYGNFDNTNEQVLNKISQILVKTELLFEQDGFIYSKRVLENKKQREIISEKRSLAGKRSAEIRQKATSVKQVSTSVQHEVNKGQQGKERKGKEIKGKEIKGKEIINTSSRETAVAVSEDKPINDVTFVFSIFKQHYGVSPKPIKASGKNFDLNSAAARRLVKVHTRPVLKKMLEFVLKYQTTDKYCRISTNPLDFERNYSWYKTYFEQKKIDLNKRRIEKLTD